MKSTSRNQRFFLFALIAIGAIIIVADAKPPSRISGAPDARPGVFTWQVSIRKDPPTHYCGGAIISNRHILTAGHCIANKDIRTFIVYGGITHLQDPNAIKANVVKAYLPPQYAPRTANRTIQDDIGILELDRPLYLGRRLTKVSLPTSPPRTNQFGSVAGWGFVSNNPVTVRTLTLKAADVMFMNDKDCENLRKRTSVGPHYFCGLQKSGNNYPGDSGSPLVSEGVVYGVASSSVTKVHVPDFYTNVYDYRNWINSIIAGSSYRA